jgi:hemerythrin
MLEWKSDYATGVLAVDSQHKVLFDYINRLEKLLEKTKIDRSEADGLLTFLEDYAVLHFRGEENCMARFQCPAFEANKEGHALFLNNLKFYRGQYENLSKPNEMLERLHESMVWWIDQHILKVDVQLRETDAANQGKD